MTITREHWMLIGLLAAGVVAGLLMQHGGIVKLSAEADTATDMANWQPDHYGIPGIAEPHDIEMTGAARLHRQHPLFRRPKMTGGHRALVIQNGWDWFVNPPSEADL